MFNSVDRCVFLDSEYHFGSCLKKSEWKYHKAQLRIQTIRIGKGPIKVVDVWKDKPIWDEIFSYLEQGYTLVAHNAIADVRPDLCDERILPYILNGQVYCTLYGERLVHGMTDPIGAWGEEGASVDEEFEDDDNLDNEHKDFSKVFALDALIYRHTGVVVKKLYQDPRNYLKAELPQGVLDYCKEDIKYLPKIYENQIKEIERLELEDVVKLNMELLATSYIIFKYGVAIDINELTTKRKDYKVKAADLEGKLVSMLPKVPYTDTQLIDMYFKLFWKKGGIHGFTNKSVAEKAVKTKQNHAFVSAVWSWVAQNKEKYAHPVNLSAPAQKLESFKRAGIKLPDTSEKVIKNYILENESPMLESYLTWQQCNSLLKKVLEKFDYGQYLRQDNTIRTTYQWVNPLNGRSSASEANVQQIPRDLKTIFGSPPGMVRIDLDYCLHPSTDLLTQRGWVPVLELKDTDKVWQVNKDTLEGSFVKPSRLINREYRGRMFRIGNTRGSIHITENHTMLYGAQQGIGRDTFRRVCKSQEGFKHGELIFTSSYMSTVSNYSITELDTVCMLQADSSFDILKDGSISYHVEVSKERKVDRLKELLGREGIKRLKRQNQIKDSYWWGGIRFTSKLLEGKTFNLDSLGANQAEDLLKYLTFWDGSYDRETATYSSCSKLNIDRLQAYFVRCGYEAKVSLCRRISETHNQCYNLRVQKQTGIRLRPSKDIQEYVYEGPVGCVTVPEGFILVRSEGQSFITGNCAVEFYKLLNDYPEPDLTRIMLSDEDDIHIYNGSKFFNRDYKELLALHKAKDPETKKLRNAAKTVIYFLQYKTPKKPEERFVTGTAKLMEVFRTEMSWELSKEEAEHMIVQGENILKSWTREKLAIDEDIIRLTKSKRILKSRLLRHLTESDEDIEKAIEEGIIYFRGAKQMYYKFDILRDHIYAPEHSEWDAKNEVYKDKKEYVNSRSLYSCAIAGPIAIGAKEAVRRTQRELLTKYGMDKARLNLFVHDSFTCYCLPELAEEVQEILVRNALEACYDVAKFNVLPLKVEGGIEGQPDSIWSYDGRSIEKL